jgi:hypothetical protein
MKRAFSGSFCSFFRIWKGELTFFRTERLAGISRGIIPQKQMRAGKNAESFSIHYVQTGKPVSSLLLASMDGISQVAIIVQTFYFYKGQPGI